jgi:uncharacterized membrane protein
MEDILQLVQKYFELVIEWAVLLCELIGVIMIVLTAIRGVIAWIRKNPHARLIAAEGIAIALTFKMGGEVLRTVIVREWQELLVLGAIVLLRTIMSFIIHFEIRSERQTLEGIHSIMNSIKQKKTPKEQPEGQPEEQPEETPEGQPAEPKKFPAIKL